LWHASAHPLTCLNHSPLASSGSQSAVITKPFAPPVVQSTLHTLIDTRLPASTPFPVPARIHDGPSLTSTTQIGPSPPVSFGGDTPANIADSGFSDVLDVISPAIPTSSGGQPQGITAATIGGLVDPSIPNGETIGPVPLTSALLPGEIGISSITTAPPTTAISTIPPSPPSRYVVPFVLPLHTSDDCMSSVGQIDIVGSQHGPDNDGNKSKITSDVPFTETFTETSGTHTSIGTSETVITIPPTKVPVHSHRYPNRSATSNSGLAQLDDDMPLTIHF
jgi:hypothetical protein